MTRKVSKMCLVCGNEFKGTEGRFTCGNACRTAMSRMLANGKKPEYWLLAKNKGQKVPLFFKRTEPKKPEKHLDSNIEYSKTTPKSYDSDKISFAKIDEVALIEQPKVLTLQEKFYHNAEIDKKIALEKNRQLTPGMHPKLFRMQQDDLIAELEKQKL